MEERTRYLRTASLVGSVEDEKPALYWLAWTLDERRNTNHARQVRGLHDHTEP